MKYTLLFSSGFLFLGGTLLVTVSMLIRSDVLTLLGGVLMFMGGIPLVCFWWQGLSKLLPDESKTTVTSDNSKKEDPSDENT